MSAIKDKNVVLIGGAGFIGHHLALALAKLGAKVSIIDSLQINNFLSFYSAEFDNVNREFYLRMINQRLDILREAGIKLYVQDARDYHLLSKRLSSIEPEVVVHLAAVAHAGKSNKDPFSTFDHSLRTLENALDYSRDKVKRFIYFSSSMVYGNFQSGQVDEETLCDPVGIYGALKFSGEKIVTAYNQVFGLPYTIIRPSALYGERCVSRRVGQVFIENAMQDQGLVVQGDGSESLDFTYVDDLVDGVVRVVERPEAVNQIFNMTYGKSRQVKEMVAVLQNHFPRLEVKYEPKDKLMPVRGTLSVDKARKLLGYNPAYPIEKGFVKYIEWYKQVFDEKKMETPVGVIG
jgi:nucleoside-diphosphate-sugar epimerase